MKKVKIESTFEVYDTVEEFASPIQALIQKASEARKKAYAPYSEFLVGAALELENGEIISGNNQENASYPSGLCAERITQELNFRIKKYFAWQLLLDQPSIQPPNPSLLVGPADKHCQNMK